MKKIEPFLVFYLHFLLNDKMQHISRILFYVYIIKKTELYHKYPVFNLKLLKGYNHQCDVHPPASEQIELLFLKLKYSVSIMIIINPKKKNQKKLRIKTE